MKSIFVKSKINMEDIKEQKNNAIEGWRYALQRMDLLIISISGAGVYVCLEAIKYSSEKHYQNVWLIKIGGLLFVLGIVINFISQLTGKLSNKYELFRCQKILMYGAEQDDDQKGKIAHDNCMSEVYEKWTNGLNTASMILMFTGLIVLIIYFTITF